MKDYLSSKASEIEKIFHAVETTEDVPANIKDLTLRQGLATTHQHSSNTWEQSYGVSWCYAYPEMPDAQSTPPTAERALKSGGNCSRE